MIFRFLHRNVSLFAIALAALALGACSTPPIRSSGDSSSALPALKPMPLATGHSRKASMTSGAINATMTISEVGNPSGAIVAGQLAQITITFSANSYPQDLNGAFTATLPWNSANRHFYIPATEMLVVNGCAGLTATYNTPAPSYNLTMSASTPGAQLNQQCSISFNAVPVGDGQFNGGAGSWPVEPGQTFSWGNPLSPQSFAVAEPTNHLYQPSGGAVEVRSVGGSWPVVCTITSAAISGARAVAVNPANGLIYVLNTNNTIAVFDRVHGTTCPSTAITSWPVPPASVSLTVDSNNNVAVSSNSTSSTDANTSSGCTSSSATWFRGNGVQIAQFAAPPGACYQDITADYWNHIVYLQNTGGLGNQCCGTVMTYSVASAQPNPICFNFGMVDYAGYDLDNLDYDGPWHIAAGFNALYSAFGVKAKIGIQYNVATAGGCSVGFSSDFLVKGGSEDLSSDVILSEIYGGAWVYTLNGSKIGTIGFGSGVYGP